MQVAKIKKPNRSGFGFFLEGVPYFYPSNNLPKPPNAEPLSLLALPPRGDRRSMSLESGMDWMNTFPVPVSYTHLDVYKRQG